MLIYNDIFNILVFKLGEKCETLFETIATEYTDYNVS